jgi:ribonuclease E
MSKEIYISSTPHETRLAIVENDALTEIYYERENEYTLAGSIYNGKVTRVLPGMQSSFVDIGLERDAFLYITDFMEEAGDSADFDTSGNAPKREPRGDRQDRPERNRDAAPASTPELAAPVAAEESGNRPERSGNDRGGNDRGERSGRGGRGRRDRNRNGNRQPGTDRPANSEVNQPAVSAEPSFTTSEVDFSHHPSADAPLPDRLDGELGEGAPGADGSRRWRGRRGRRRGRGPGQRDEVPASTSQSANQSAAPQGGDFEDYKTSKDFALDASAEPEAPAAPRNTGPISSAYGEPTEQIGEQKLEAGTEQPRRDRNERNGRGRNRNRGGRDRGNREGGERTDASRADAPRVETPRPETPRPEAVRTDDRAPRNEGNEDRRPRGEDRGPRAPRGFAPKVAHYGVEETPAYGQTAYEAPTGEPIILPGESLSKYRKGGEETPAAKPFTPDTIVLPTASGYTVSADWDGGSVLPGETLRRRPEGRQESRPEGRRQDGRNDNRSENRSDRRPGSNRDSNREPRADHRMDDRSDLRNAAPAPVVEAVIVPAVPVEYEPTEASASYRIDPVAQSEFRQSAPAPVVEVQTEYAEPEAAPTEPEAVHAEASPVHTITPAPEEHVAPLESSHVAEPVAEAVWDWQQPAEISHHETLAADVTTLQSTGEMVSVPPTIEPVSAPAPQEIADPAEPILHETAIVTPSNENREEHQERQGHHEREVISYAQPQSDLEVAPEGAIIEEEDFFEEKSTETATHAHSDNHASGMDSNVDALNASSIEEMDDLDEEETLEGAADLGTMIREMSIDQITRPSDAEGEADLDSDEDDYEDFEEEDSIDDHLDGDSEETESSNESESYEEHSDSESEAAQRSGAGGFTEEMFASPSRSENTDSAETAATPAREGERSRRREGGRRDGRRDGRNSGRDRDRSRNTGGAGDRERSGGRGRQSMQSTNLPAISDLLKPGQEVLVQIAKEPIAKKGARITSHIALPGRFLVFMPTVNHTGVSRKIESDGERRRLKEILLSEKGDAAGGFIVRTAASGASEEELRSDLRFLLNLWTDIKTRSESSKSPALIYHDLNLVERILRDQVTDNFSAIWVDTETDYERILRFLQRFQPALIRRVKLYSKETPLFEQFGITEEINKALRSKVWLKSGGSIVINQTEALVAIDINTGKFVGKTARLEDTIVKTNLDAIPEIVRQIRLRDLGGIIIIDFIDMDERKNRNRVMAALEDELKSDRAPSKVLQFNDFGLVAITRKRVKQSLERTLSTTCNVCVGTGMVKSPITVCNDIYIEMRKMHKHLDRGDVMLRVHPEVVKALKSTSSRWLQEMEEMAGKTILVKSDPTLHPEQFDIH